LLSNAALNQKVREGLFPAVRCATYEGPLWAVRVGGHDIQDVPMRKFPGAGDGRFTSATGPTI
jgi:hypothetical protein